MFCVGFDGTAVTPNIRRLIERGISGVILFGRNVGTAAETALLVARVIQAGGTAIMLPLLMTTVMTLVPPTRRGAVMGNISTALK